MSDQFDSNSDLSLPGHADAKEEVGNEYETRDKLVELEAASMLMLETLTSNPDQVQVLEEVFSHHLSDSIVVDTADELYTSLSLYIGNDQAQALWYLLQKCISEDKFIDDCGSRLGEAMLPVRHLLALYATSLAEVFQLQGRDPEEWRSISTSTSFNMVSKTWLTRIEIIKCSGESLIFTDSPASILTLIEALLNGIDQLPDEFKPGEIGPEQVFAFRKASERFLNTFSLENAATEELKPR